MAATKTEILATVLFVLAVLHTFSVKQFARWAHRLPSGSIAENMLHFLAETEVVFGLLFWFTVKWRIGSGELVTGADWCLSLSV